MMSFLTDTSILEELSPELCDAVLGRAGSGVTLRAAPPATCSSRLSTAARALSLPPPAARSAPGRALPGGSARAHAHPARGTLVRRERPFQPAFGHRCGATTRPTPVAALGARAAHAVHEGRPRPAGPLDSDQPRADRVRTGTGPAGGLPRAFHRQPAPRRPLGSARSARPHRDARIDAIPGFLAGLAVVEAAGGAARHRGHVRGSGEGRELAEPGSLWLEVSCLLAAWRCVWLRATAAKRADAERRDAGGRARVPRDAGVTACPSSR